MVLIDNDVLVRPGWLEALLRCAEETEAWLVGPLYCLGTPTFRRVHMAGGSLRLEDRADGRFLLERHYLSETSLAEVGPSLRRRPDELVKFHCVLARTDALRRLGGLDEGFLSDLEHVDLCLAVQQAGGHGVAGARGRGELGAASARDLVRPAVLPAPLERCLESR